MLCPNHTHSSSLKHTPILFLITHRLVQKDVGQDAESLWLLATESWAPEDFAAWPPTNPAAARQLLGGFSSLPNVAKQCARGALLVSNTLPLKVRQQRGGGCGG